MEGKIFLKSNDTPPRIAISTAFTFDLQRFAEQTVSWYTYNNGWSSLKTGTFAEFKADAESSSYTRVELNSNLELESDINAVGDIAVEGNFTIDLKGYSITNATRNALHTFNSGTLTIDDTSQDKSGTITSSATDYNCVNNYGNLILKAGSIVGNTYHGIYNQGNVTVSGGSVEGKTYQGIYNDGSGTVNVGGGSITGNNHGIYSISTGNITVTDGTITGTNYDGIYTNKAGVTVKISGGSVTGRYGINNNNGTVELSGGTITGSTYYSVVNNNGSFTMSDGSLTSKYGVHNTASTFTINGGTVSATESNSSAVMAYNSSTVTMTDGTITSSGQGVTVGKNDKTYTNKNDKFIMTGGTINARAGVMLFNGGASFEMSGGEINTTTFATSNNGNSWNQDATIIIKGGTLTSSGAAGIYHAGPGTTNIDGGTITGTSGVEIRAGELNVTGGTITGTGDPYTSDPNGNGSTSSGAGIAVPQHTTKKSITVNISGNNTNISGANALAVANPQNNEASESVGEVTATINGATLKSTTTATSGKPANGGNAILSNNANVKLTVLDGNLDGNVTVTKDTVNGNESTAQTTLKMQGGTTTGKVQVVKVTRATAGGEITDTETDTSNEAKEALQVTGGTYSDTTSASKYTTSDVTVNDEGEVVNAGAGWTARDDSENAYDYLVKSGGASATLISATIGADSASSLSSLKADAANYLIGVYEGAATATGNAADSIKSQYYFSTFKSDGTAITLTPQTAGFKIKGTTFIGDVTELTANGSTGINVDATSNSLTNITGGAGNDNLLAGDRNTTLDGGNGNNVLQGGTGNDSLKGGTGNDEFIYTAGNDTVNGFGTGDIVRTTLTAVTDGSKLTTVTDGFKLDFGSGNTLTFTNAAVSVSLSDGSSSYIYTQDLIKQGNGVTLGADATAFDGTISSLSAVSAVDGSAVTDDLTITDNAAQSNNITFGQGKNTFNYTSGSDTITGYTYGTDIVSLAAGLTAPTSFDNVNYDGSNLAINFDASNILTFNTASNVSIAKDTATYSYKGHSNGGMDYIALNSASGNGISLGAQYSTVFSGTLEANANYTTIDASKGSNVVRIIGNDQSNYIVSGSKGGTISGGEGADTITAANVEASLTLNGGAGDDLLIGGTVYNRFEYSEGKDTISGYHDKDLINVTGRNVSFADVTVSAVGGGENNDLLISFDSDNQLSIAGGANFDNAISVTSGSRLYKFTKDYIAHNKGITLAAGYEDNFSADGDEYKNYETINAAAVTTEGGIEIYGNANNNYIVGSNKGGTLDGSTGNDKLNVNDRETSAKYIFSHTAGKDEIIGFASDDSLDIDVESITSAKVGNNRLTLTISKDNSVILRGDDDITKVLLNEEQSYLTKDGYVAVGNTPTNARYLRLFASARGRIDLTSDIYKDDTAITAIDAMSVKNQSVTLVGSENLTDVAFAANNKKRDGFIYGGGNVDITGYEAGRDRIDLGSASLTSFSVVKNGDNKDLALTTGNGVISILGAGGQEVLLHDTSKGNGYKKMVFAQTGVIENKQKNPTMATVSGAATGYSAIASPTVKKIFVTGLTAAASIQAGNKNNTQIDASNAGKGVSLSGGAKNDKLIGSAYEDTFIYTAGKDVIQSYSDGDSISIGDFESSLSSAKITAGSKSIKFQFNNKNTLTIKANNGETLGSALTIGDTNYTYTKNAIESGGQATLTNAFSGTFDTANHKVTTVNGSAVSKNLTYKGSDVAESLVGGTKKTTFKGGGGDDKLVGGSGKDIFFYAKGEKGNVTIADFEFGTNGRAGNDKLKIASGTIGEISTIDGGVQFAMNSGKKGDTSNIGWFQIKSGYNTSTKEANQNIDATKVAIKANNTLYWFNQASDAKDVNGNDVAIGQLITSDSRVSASDVSGLSVIDLNYSTNLAKAGVAVKVTGAKPK